MRGSTQLGVLALVLAGCAAIPLVANQLLIHLAFDENGAASTFVDSSSYKLHGTCSASGASCPKSGLTGKSGKSVYFAEGCTRSYGSASRGDFIKNAATCGSRLDFPAVSLRDGTVMLWYKEIGHNDGNPTVISKPEAAVSLSVRSPVDLGWDLSLVGGNGVTLGRLGPNHWGGYWCGKWHVSKPTHATSSVGDSSKGWDHLEWHHFAVVFSGTSAMVYIDGTLTNLFSNSKECDKSISFLGERTVRYTEQSGVRETEMTGLTSARAKNGDMLAALEWSTNYFQGYIDDFRIYNKVLSQSEIASMM